MKHDKLSTTAFFGNSPRLVHSLLNALSIRLALQHLEQDVDIMAWALGTALVPENFAGPQMDAMKKLDYVEIPR